MQIKDITYQNLSNSAALLTAQQPQSGVEPARWYLRNAQARTFWPSVTYLCRMGKTPKQATRAILTFSDPIQKGEEIQVARADVTFVLPPGFTEDEVQVFTDRVRKILANADIISVINSQQPMV